MYIYIAQFLAFGVKGEASSSCSLFFFITGVVDTGDTLMTGVVDTADEFMTGVLDISDKSLNMNIFA